MTTHATETRVAPFHFGGPPMGLFKLEAVSLRNAQLTEKWVQDQIAAEPTLLGLGDLVLKGFERIQPGAGRLDLLLQDQDLDTPKRYEVEIQLGATDPSHIIRTIEYWDIERKRYPQYKHAAVIVAEDITTRFLNVIQLFNGTIPLIALKMTAYKVGEDYALTFVKVLDELTYGLDDGDDAGVADRAYWEKRATPETLQATDNLLKIVNEVEPKAVLRYVKNVIGLQADGLPLHFLWFIPKKVYILLQIKLPQSDEADKQLEDAKIEARIRGPGYQLTISGTIDNKQRGVLLSLIRQASEEYRKA